MIEIESLGDQGRLNIIGEMTLSTAAELKESLLDALHQSDSLIISLAEVDDMDTAGLQVLLLLKREALELGKALQLQEHSPAIIDVLDTCHVMAYFGDPVLLDAPHHSSAQE